MVTCEHCGSRLILVDSTVYGKYRECWGHLHDLDCLGSDQHLADPSPEDIRIWNEHLRRKRDKEPRSITCRP